MRRNRLVLVVALAAPALGALIAGCGNNAPAGVFADVQWQVRCDIMGMCTRPDSRDVLGYDGEDGNDVSCTVVQDATSRTVTFRAESDGFSLAARNVVVPIAGGSGSGAGCRVTVEEGNTYEGVCGGGTPSDAQPCQIRNVQFYTDEVSGSAAMRGELRCEGIRATAAPDLRREITAPGDAASYVQFTFYDCRGLSL